MVVLHHSIFLISIFMLMLTYIHTCIHAYIHTFICNESHNVGGWVFPYPSEVMIKIF